MITKKEFQEAIADTIASYPAIAPLYHAQDPRIHQHLDAMATMLSMLSQQIEVATAEVFRKTRTSTVLADAAMRGIVPKATPARARIVFSSEHDQPITIGGGRILYDTDGRDWILATDVTIPAGGTVTGEVTQERIEEVIHTVADSMPFYAIPIPESTDGSHLSGIDVVVDGETYAYRDRYVQCGAGDLIYHIECDDRQTHFVRFGMTDRVGVQHDAGTIVTLFIRRSYGNVKPDYGETFSLDYLTTQDEAAIEVRMESIVRSGQDPISISALREVARFPAVYDSDAVYLGEFHQLIRTKHPELRFVSAWCESLEERVRGYSLDSINAIFVAVAGDDGEMVINAVDDIEVTEPIEVAEVDATATQKAIIDTIKTADNSYKVRFYTPVREPIGVTINAAVSSAYAASDVEQQIRDVVLSAYGDESTASRYGDMAIRYHDLYRMLRESVPALSGSGAELQISVAQSTPTGLRPERWRFVSSETINVSVAIINTVSRGWG